MLPAEAEGGVALTRLDRDEQLLRKIFEAGIAGYLHYHLDRHDGWSVRRNRHFHWTKEQPSLSHSTLMPGMRADIVLEQGDRRIVVDTKFTSILGRPHHDVVRFKSTHIYQLYSYLRSQEGFCSQADRAEGLLLYPSLGPVLDEAVILHGHRIQFVTLDLTLPSPELGPKVLKTIIAD